MRISRNHRSWVQDRQAQRFKIKHSQHFTNSHNLSAISSFIFLASVIMLFVFLYFTVHYSLDFISFYNKESQTCIVKKVKIYAFDNITILCEFPG